MVLFNMYLYKLVRIPRKIRMFIYIVYNRLYYKMNNVKIGNNFRVFTKTYLLKDPTAIITIGDNFLFTNGESYNPLCRNIRGAIYAQPNAVITIGNNVGLSSVCIWSNKSITIGDNVLIGGDSILLDTDAHSLDYRIRRNINFDGKLSQSSPIIIEDDVLIGTRCIVLKGVTIGARSIIGSGSIVTKSIPQDCIAAGNPCRVVKFINE